MDEERLDGLLNGFHLHRKMHWQGMLTTTTSFDDNQQFHRAERL
jgi:hypothetical protein